MKEVLLVIDIQKEYNTNGRPFCLKGVESSLANAKLVLEEKRNNKTPIIHIQHLQDGEIFNASHPASGFIEGFEPKDGETVIVKSNFSCFSSKEFEQLMKNYKDYLITVIGYGSTMCCISTIIDGYHRGYKFQFNSKASLARASGALNEQQLHQAAIEILRPFTHKIIE